MRFLIHDEDGRITQSNKVYDQDGYGDVLRRNGITRFVTDHGSQVLDPDAHFVANGGVVARPRMRPTCYRLTIKCGDGDAAIFEDLPRPCRVRVCVDRAVIHDVEVPAGRLEFSAPVPGFYRLEFEAFPYRPWGCTVRVEQ